jgi:hypothetical protein
LSNLASSCEYLNFDKTCAAFSDTSKAKTNSSRQLKCKNEQKTVCCYLCIFRAQCVISCKYLESSENQIVSKPVSEDTFTVAKTLQAKTLPLESIPVAFCFSCNLEMIWAKTQFTIDNWRGNQPPQLVNDKMLPVTVLLCPKCGKVEFKADLIRKVEEM